MASQKLSFLQKIDPQHAMAAVAKARAAGAGPKAASGPSSSTSSKTPEIFAALDKRLADNPGLKNEVQAEVTFHIGDTKKTYDLAGKGAKTTIGLSDADFADLASGKTTARDLFQHGKLRVDGDVAPAHRLTFLKGLI